MLQGGNRGEGYQYSTGPTDTRTPGEFGSTGVRHGGSGWARRASHSCLPGLFSAEVRYWYFCRAVQRRVLSSYGAKCHFMVEIWGSAIMVLLNRGQREISSFFAIASRRFKNTRHNENFSMFHEFATGPNKLLGSTTITTSASIAPTLHGE